jgi:hypothetical protein
MALPKAQSSTETTQEKSNTTALASVAIQEDRSTLILFLNKIGEERFETLLDILNIPTEYLSGKSAGLAIRVSDLIRLAEAPGGCGLEGIRKGLERLSPIILPDLKTDANSPRDSLKYTKHVVKKLANGINISNDERVIVKKEFETIFRKKPKAYLTLNDIKNIFKLFFTDKLGNLIETYLKKDFLEVANQYVYLDFPYPQIIDYSENIPLNLQTPNLFSVFELQNRILFHGAPVSSFLALQAEFQEKSSINHFIEDFKFDNEFKLLISFPILFKNEEFEKEESCFSLLSLYESESLRTIHCNKLFREQEIIIEIWNPMTFLDPKQSFKEQEVEEENYHLHVPEKINESFKIKSFNTNLTLGLLKLQ